MLQCRLITKRKANKEVKMAQVLCGQKSLIILQCLQKCKLKCFFYYENTGFHKVLYLEK